MADFVDVVVCGTIGNSEVAHSKNTGKKYIKFSVAVNSYKNGERESTAWYNVYSFSTSTVSLFDEKLENLGKGCKVCVTGALKVENYTKQDGTPSYNLKIFSYSTRILKKPTNIEKDNAGHDENAAKEYVKAKARREYSDYQKPAEPGNRDPLERHDTFNTDIPF